MVIENFSNNGVTFRYCRSSQKKPTKILCLPGAMVFLEHAKPFLEALDKAGLEVYGLEYRDHGDSSIRNTASDKLSLHVDDFDTYTNDIHKFIKKHLNGEKFILLGNSFGGHLALRYVQEYGDAQIQHMTLIAPMINVISPFWFLPRSCMPAVIRFLSWMKSPHAYAPGYNRKTAEDVIRKEKNKMYKNILSNHKEKIVSRLSLAWVSAALRSIDKLCEMEPIQPPVTVFLGKNENVVDNQAALQLVKLITQQSTFHFLNCSHRVIDQHLDDVVSQIRAVHEK